MGIVIKVSWPTQTEEEQEELEAAWVTRTAGGEAGVLAAYSDDEAAALQLLCPEVFQGVSIPAANLRARLERVLEELEVAVRAKHPSYSEKTVKGVKQNYRNFVALCERKERETGQPVFFSESE